MDALIKKMRKARESQVKVDKFTFTIRRPQEGEYSYISELTAVDLAVRFVVDWEGVTEADLIPAGSTDLPGDVDALDAYSLAALSGN